MRAVLVTFFNSNNIGDQLIGETLDEMVSEYFEVDKVSYSGSLQVIDDNNSISNEIVERKFKFNKLLKNNILSGISRFYYKKINTPNFGYYEEKIKNADVLIIGGGNMIFDMEKYTASAMRFFQFVKIAKKYNKKIFAISLGIGPFQSKAQAYDAVYSLEKCDYITFRDQKSHDIFKKYNSTHINTKVAVDPVFFLSNQKTKNIISEDKIIVGLNIINGKLINQSQTDFNKSISEYVKLTQQLAKRKNLKLILFSTELADYDAVDKVFNQLKGQDNIHIRYIKNSKELLSLYDELNILIGTRMHSMIIAITQRIPVIGLSWQNKVDAFFDIINQSESVFAYSKLGDNIQQIKKLLDCKIDNYEDEINKIDNALHCVREKNLYNFEYLQELKENENLDIN